MDILEMAMAAKMAGGGGTTSIIKTVNGVGPDENGNVTVEVPEGGGAKSWNDLEDRPFGDAVEEVCLVNNKTYQSALNSTFGAYSFDISRFGGRHGYGLLYGMRKDQPCTITWDGMTKTYNPVPLNMMGVSFVAYGNIGMFAAFGYPAENTGEPFVGMFFDDGSATFFTVDTASTNHVVSITAKADVYKGLDMNYLGIPCLDLSAMGFSTFTLDGVQNVEMDTTALMANLRNGIVRVFGDYMKGNNKTPFTSTGFCHFDGVMCYVEARVTQSLLGDEMKELRLEIGENYVSAVVMTTWSA